MVVITARATGQVLPIMLIVKYPAASPQIRISMVRRRPNRSLNQPPPGRAARFMKAKPEANNPAFTGSRSKVSMKKNGSMETTASSEPKVTK